MEGEEKNPLLSEDNSVIEIDDKSIRAIPNRNLRASERPWTRRIDWALSGYCIFNIAAWLYFFQALSPFFPELFKNDEDRILGLVAAILYLIDSIVYLCGWYIENRIHIEKGITTVEQGEMLNLWGNILFVFGSIGYVITGVNAFLNCCDSFNDLLNLYLSVLFLVDGWVYLCALIAGENARTARPEETVVLFHSSVDWYFFATATFILGSAVYLFSALSKLLGTEATVMNLIGAFIFVVDGILYLISGLQYRDKEETPFVHRIRYTAIERKL